MVAHTGVELALVAIASLVWASPAVSGVRPEAAVGDRGQLVEGGHWGDADVLLRLVDLCTVYPQDFTDDVLLRFAVRIGSPPSDARRLSRVLGFCRTRRGRCAQLAVTALSPKAHPPGALAVDGDGQGAAGAATSAVQQQQQSLNADEQKIVGYMKVLAESRGGRADFFGIRRKRNVHPLYIRLFREFCRSYSWRCGPAAGEASTSRPRVTDS